MRHKGLMINIEDAIKSQLLHNIPSLNLSNSVLALFYNLNLKMIDYGNFPTKTFPNQSTFRQIIVCGQMPQS